MKKIFLILFVLFPFLTFSQGSGVKRNSYTKTQSDVLFAPKISPSFSGKIKLHEILIKSRTLMIGKILLLVVIMTT